MPWFRRKADDDPATAEFTVGVDGHRVRVGDARGCEFLDGIDDWVSSMERRRAAAPGADGRDSVALLNAKMDYAELVDDAVSVVVLAFEELVERGDVDEAAVPERPRREKLRETRTYDFIQHAYDRAVERRRWLEEADGVLREHTVSILRPLPRD